MKRTKIPTIIGIFLLVVGIVAGVLLVRNRQTFRLGAETSSAPKNVRITNITESSFTVSWITDKEVAGFIKYGEGASLNKTELDEVGEAATSHYVAVQGLSPQTQYAFKINSGGTEYDQQGSPWQVTTGSPLPSPESNIVSGSVALPSGAVVKNALVYVSVGGSSPLSTVTSDKGVWLLNIGGARENTLSSYVTVDPINTLLEISVQTGSLGVATAQVYPQSARPVPQITLGQSHDFKNLPPSEDSGIPEANLDLPEGATRSSGFEVEGTTPSTTTSVTLESIEEGEVITTQEPEFFGDGPAGAEITITVQSDPVTETVTVGGNGSWNWSPPAGLPEGPHTITISWRDTSGILRTLKRTFIVQAAEGPAFESTPSAGTSPTPSSSPSPTPTSTPKPSQSPTPVATPTPTATPEELVAAGTLTPTYLLSIMGMTLLLISGVVGYLSFKE